MMLNKLFRPSRSTSYTENVWNSSIRKEPTHGRKLQATTPVSLQEKEAGPGPTEGEEALPPSLTLGATVATGL